MADPKVIIWLAETKVSSSDDSDAGSWSDVCSVKAYDSSESEGQDNDTDTLFFPLMQYLIRLRRRRVDDYLHIVDSWTDAEFKNRLRLSRKTAYRLIDDLEKSGFIASHKFGLKPLEPKLCFYIFLSFIANTEPLTPIATKFDISISSTFRVIRRVVAWMLTKLNDAIKWPQNYNDIRTICDAFQQKTGISNTLGVIDCTHIKIEKPKNARDYCNPKGYYSIILQATVDSNMRFTNIFCGEPGSSNCARVLRKSPIYNTATANRDALFPHDTFLIGHSGYPSLPWLVPPFRENKRLTPHQREYNAIHASTRKLSDKTFNLLKDGRNFGSVNFNHSPTYQSGGYWPTCCKTEMGLGRSVGEMMGDEASMFLSGNLAQREESASPQHTDHCAPARWLDDISSTTGPVWGRSTANWVQWRKIGEVYAQRWVQMH